MSRKLQLDTERMLAQIDADGIGWVTFNNPARHNALSLEMWQAMGDIFESFEQDSTVRVCVMSGAGGKAFVSGADISEFDARRASAAQRAEYAEISGRGSRALARFSKPLIAKIDGYCIGGGLATALAADVRFATPESTFGIPAARLGLGYEYEGIGKLCRLVGPARARDIMLSARYFDTAEAQSMGLVNACFQHDALDDEVSAYALRIAGNAPLTVGAAKAAIDAWERGGRSQDLEAVQRLVDACFDSEDYKEGRRAFAAKRPPQFSGR
ncbi:MAG: enoyl-CoA hydratase [Pseudomonadota bacterium]